MRSLEETAGRRRSPCRPEIATPDAHLPPRPAPGRRGAGSGRALIALVAYAGLGAAGPTPAQERPKPATVVLVADCALDAIACAAARTAIEGLSTIPRRRPVVFEPHGTGASATTGAGRALAVVEVTAQLPDPDGGSKGGAEGGSPGGVRRTTRIELARCSRRGAPGVTPAWLVHAALEAGRAAGVAPRVATGASGSGQLVARVSLAARPSAADRALEAGVPAVRLALPESDGALWLSAVVRRLDALEDRPAAGDQYLVVGRSVWTRRGLYWLGGVLWAALVVAGRPGPWRRSATADRHLRGRRYLRGLPFRLLFLASLLWSPALALPLLGPAALCALGTGGSASRRAVRRVIACTPAILLALAVAASLAAGEAKARRPGPSALLIAAALVAWEVQVRRPAPSRAERNALPPRG